jgi:MFS family permease
MAFLAPSGEWAIDWLTPGAALTAAPYGVAAAALQQILPGEMRSQIAAFYLLVVNLVGAATGPTLTAVLTQRLFRRDDALNHSLLMVHAFVDCRGDFAVERTKTGFSNAGALEGRRVKGRIVRGLRLVPHPCLAVA